jgi:hypothetical protein
VLNAGRLFNSFLSILNHLWRAFSRVKSFSFFSPWGDWDFPCRVRLSISNPGLWHPGFDYSRSTAMLECFLDILSLSVEVCVVKCFRDFFSSVIFRRRKCGRSGTIPVQKISSEYGIYVSAFECDDGNRKHLFHRVASLWDHTIAVWCHTLFICLFLFFSLVWFRYIVIIVSILVVRPTPIGAKFRYKPPIGSLFTTFLCREPGPCPPGKYSCSSGFWTISRSREPDYPGWIVHLTEGESENHRRLWKLLGNAQSDKLNKNAKRNKSKRKIRFTA